MALYKHIILRVDKPNIGKVVGDVIDSLPVDTFEGTEVNVLHKDYVKVIANISEELNSELVSGVRHYRKPDLSDPFYVELLTFGVVSANEETILSYTELTNA
jgi:hypothetical protein